MHYTLIARWILAAAALSAAVAPVVATDAMPPLPTPQFRSYGLQEGLPSSKVQAVAQDSRGFIWVATSAGLARFDGVEFTVPGVGEASGPALPAGELSSIVVDSKDRLWIAGPELGLGRYDPATRRFEQWRDGLSDDDVRAVVQARDGTIWVGTAKGLDRLRADGSGFDDIAAGATGLRSASVRTLFASDDGRLWVGTDVGVDVLDGQGHVRHVRFDDATPPAVHRIDGDPSELRFATDRGLYRVDRDGVARRDTRLPPTRMYASLADAHGTLWVANVEGLMMLDRQGRLHTVAGSWTAQGGLPGRMVRSILEDREHGLWFALSDGGLAYLGPAWDDFTRFAHVATDAYSFPGRTVTAIAARGDEGLWVGGLRGWVRRFDPATGRADGGYDIGPARIQSLLEAPGGHLLIGTVDGLSMATGKRVVPLLRETIQRPVTAMVTAPDGRIYLGVMGQGVFVMDARFASARALPFDEVRRGQADTRQIEIVGDELWQASVAGLARYDRTTRTLRYIDGVAPGRVSAFEPDDAGFWVVRPEALEHYLWTDGVAVLDRSIRGADGLPSPDILNLRRDATGRLWLYGLTGAWRFDPGAGTFRPFGLADGLANGEFTHATTVMLADGTMYGATLGGLVGFRPDRQRDHVRRPAVVVLGAVAVRDGQRRDLPIVDGVLRLGWDDSDLAITARTLSYVNPDRNQVDFALRHEDGVTVLRTGKDGQRHFGPLRPGTYGLSISGSGRDKVSGALPTPLTVIVEAPPWRRWWAWCVYAVALVFTATFFARGMRRRVRQAMRLSLAQQQQHMAEEANAAKTEFMATLGHEIRTPMTGVLGMAELMSRTPLDATQRGYLDAVRHSGAMLLRLVNDALDITRIEARRLVLENECVVLRTLADEVIALSSANAREKGLGLSLVIDPDVPRTMLGDPLRLRQVWQNLVHNAVKFTERGGVGLRLERDGDTLVVSVTDTGPGMSVDLCSRLFLRFEQGGSPQRAQGTGLGLAICRELTLLMGGEITVDSAPGRGSTFTVRVPWKPCDDEAHGVSDIDAAHRSPVGRHVLLVEDDPVVAEVIAGLLRGRGHTVAHVGDGLAAISELPRAPFDVMLLDLDLPGVDGFQVARIVRRMETYAALPIFAVTARSAGDEVSRIRAAGMDGLIRKPMSGDDLDAVLEGLDQAARLPL